MERGKGESHQAWVGETPRSHPAIQQACTEHTLCVGGCVRVKQRRSTGHGVWTLKPILLPGKMAGGRRADTLPMAKAALMGQSWPHWMGPSQPHWMGPSWPHWLGPSWPYWMDGSITALQLCLRQVLVPLSAWAVRNTLMRLARCVAAQSPLRLPDSAQNRLSHSETKSSKT